MGPGVLHMGVQPALVLAPGPDVVLAEGQQGPAHAGALGLGGQDVHPLEVPLPILDEEIAQHPVPLRRHEEGMLVQGLAVVLLHGPRGLADEGDVILESRHAAGVHPRHVL